MVNRTCTKCESTKDESLFLKKRFLCKDCDNVARKESRLKKLAEQTDEPKKCNICEETKTEKDFPPNSLKCRKCNSKVKKQRAIKLLEEQKKQGITKKMCIKCNEEHELEKFRAGENTCNICQKQMLYEWRDNNPDKFKAVCKTYREKEDKKLLINKYKRDSYNNNAVEKFSRDYRNKLREFINKDITSEREKELKKIFGCKKEKFRDWIEFCFKSGMTWDNYGELWNLDHIQPCCLFNLTDENELKQCFNWKNTVPVICEDNYKKYKKVDNDIIEYYRLRAINFKEKATQKFIQKEKEFKIEMANKKIICSKFKGRKTTIKTPVR